MWVEAKYNITEEIRDDILRAFQQRFPKTKFRGYWHRGLRQHLIEVADFKLFFTDEYRAVLGEMEDKYAPDYDIFEIAYRPHAF